VECVQFKSFDMKEPHVDARKVPVVVVVLRRVQVEIVVVT
jgi:hypothetical protein